MFDASKETNVRFMRAAIKHLQEELLQSRRTVLALKAAAAIDEELCQKLADELLVLRQRFFVGGREQGGRMGQRHDRRGRRLPHNQPPIEAEEAAPIELEADEIVYESTAPCCPSCTGAMTPMVGGFEESGEIDVTERKYTLRRHKRQKYLCRDCNKFVAAEGPTEASLAGRLIARDGPNFCTNNLSYLQTEPHHLPWTNQSN